MSRIYHPALSTTFKGIIHSTSSGEAEIWQFRGIKYGSIPARFRQSTPNQSFPEIFDASSYGPKCPQAKAPRLEEGTIGLPSHLASHAEDIYDEFNCLNLNITSPGDAHEESNLPVLVYIHGGGGRSGANSDWWNDGWSLVDKSIELGKPVIMVAINYRLAVLGYLGSSELRKENGNADGGNFGLRDVHTALAWIHRYIRPFGGNPHNITLCGESAGSLSMHAQMRSLLPAYFTRCISQSQTMGTPLFSTPQSIAEKSAVYDSIKAHLNITTVLELETVSWEKLLATYQVCDPKHALGEQVMIDDEFLGEDWADTLSFGDGEGELIIGNTGAEGAVVTLVLSAAPKVEPKPTPEAFMATLNSVLPSSKASSILKAYKISHSSSQTDFAAALLAIVEDVMWYKASSDLATKLRDRGTKVYEYGFEQQQDFGGPCKGIPGHALDLAYLHGDPTIFAECEDPEKELATQAAIQSAWIAFANGEKPWEEKKTRVFGPNGKVEDLETEVVLSGLRRGDAWKALDISKEEMTALAGVVLGFYGQLVGSG